MGYTTEFHGTFTLSQPLTEAQAAYLRAFSGTRRMKRNARLLEGVADPARVAVGLPLGADGGYFVGGGGFAGQDHDASVVDHNMPPAGQPGLWCQWVPTEGGDGIEWDGGEKFYDYVEWLEYLVEHFLKPWGIEIRGRVRWQGEEDEDRGVIVADGRDVTTRRLKLVEEE